MHPFAPVAQLDRVPDYESGGRTFESYRARHIQKKPHPTDGAFLYPVGPVEATCPFDQLLSEKFSSTPKPIGSCKKSCVTLNPGITFFL